MMTHTKTKFDKALEQFREKIVDNWSPDTDDYSKTLVYGNLNGFVGFLNETLPPPPPNEHSERLQAMLDDEGGTWDLSDNDIEAIQYAVDHIENPLVLVQQVNNDALALEKIKTARLINLLGDIIAQATSEPAKLTAFNSPLLQLAVMEVYEHNNPDAEVDERSKQIFRQMAMVGYNV